jgi:hypothetical protein
MAAAVNHTTLKIIRNVVWLAGGYLLGQIIGYWLIALGWAHRIH